MGNYWKDLSLISLPGEEWVEMPSGYGKRYLISNLCRIKRLKVVVPKTNNRNQTYPEKILKQQFNTKDYPIIKLCLEKNDSRTNEIHRLYAIAFIPNPNHLPCVNHINGVKRDISKNNLEWCTKAYNNHHAIDTGLHNTKGESHFNSKLKEREVLEIFNSKKTYRELAPIYGINPATAYDIKVGRTWNHITGLKRVINEG